MVNAHLATKGLLLKRGSIVDATIIAAPCSTKNAEGERDPEMHQTKKGHQWHFGMKARIDVDADSGLVHTVTTTAANEADIEQIADLLHGKEEHVWADSGYRGAQARDASEDLQWHIAARPSDIAKLPDGRRKAAVQKREHLKASVRFKGRAPVPGHQATVRSGEGSLPWVGQEHRACGHAVRAVEPVDGTKTVDGNGRSPPAKLMNDMQRVRRPPETTSPEPKRLGAAAKRVSSLASSHCSRPSPNTGG